MADTVNWEMMALDLSSLLDEIEKHADDEAHVRGLLTVRFQIAEAAGLKVVRAGDGTSGNA